MNSVLTQIQEVKCLVYLDDIVIHDLEEHNKRFIKVLKRASNMILQPKKCELLRKEVIYLEHIMMKNDISSKLEAVKNFPTPRRVKDLDIYRFNQVFTPEIYYQKIFQKLPNH